MRHLAHLALAVCFTITTGSVADAGSSRRAGRHAKAHEKTTHRTKSVKAVDRRAASDEDQADDDETDATARQTRSRTSGNARSVQKVGRKRARPSRSRDADKSDDDDARDRKRDKKRKDDKRHRRDDEIDIADDDEIEMNDSDADDSDADDSDADDSDDEDGDVDDSDADDSDDEDEDGDTDRVAFASRDSNDEAIDDSIGDSDELVDAPTARKRTGFRDWHIAIGPDLWAASVDANVSLGSASVSSGIDFMEITRHTRFGAAAVAEARYRRFSITGDLLYGVVDIAGAKEIGPLMVALDGTATSLLVDGIAGYRVVGTEDSLVWLEARGGIRYQRTTISGAINVSGNAVTPPQQVDAGSDALGGARVFVRPPWMSQRFAVSAAFDTRLFGSSTSTWSAGADASVRITNYVLLSLGWRTLTQDRAPVSTTMHGPRAAVQLLF